MNSNDALKRWVSERYDDIISEASIEYFPDGSYRICARGGKSSYYIDRNGKSTLRFVMELMDLMGDRVV